MKKALDEALEILQDIKGVVSELNKFVVTHNLLRVEIVTNPFMGEAGIKPKNITSILEIGLACDEQIGELQDFALKSTSHEEAKPE